MMGVVRLTLAIFAACSAIASGAQDTKVLLTAGDYRWVPIEVTDTPVRADVSYQVESGEGSVHVEIVPEDAFRPMQRGQSHEAVAATASGLSGGLGQILNSPGLYRVVIANRKGARPALVTWRITTESVTATELTPRRRLVTIVVSFALFFVLIGFSGWRLRKAANR
jgi:hypothetical protein